MAKFVVGLTGGIGSGKTAVSDWFCQNGINIIDADVIAHDITKKGSQALTEIARTFGEWVLDDGGNYNRTAMRAYVFDKPSELAKLNAITHPKIHSEIITQLAHATSHYAMLCVPLLFEGRHKTPSLLSLCHRTLVVDVPIEIQLARATARDGNLDTIKNIISRQISRDERLALADDVVDNSTTLDALYAQLIPLHEYYLNLSQKIIE